MELLPTIDALRWIAGAGAEILADEKIPMPQAFLKTKRSAPAPSRRSTGPRRAGAPVADGYS
jgi:hypothetical protein